VLKSFRDQATEALYHGSRARRLPSTIHKVALRKLDMLAAAHSLQDLRSPPGNRLERLSGNWSGLHSIRINEQWRIIFRWEDGDAHDVGIMDYH
jgi:toxin HigB-1